MADEEKKNAKPEEQPEEQASEEAAEEPASEERPAEETPAEETPAEEPAAEASADEAPADEAPAEEAAAEEEAPSEDAPAEGGTNAPAEGGDAGDDDDGMNWKVRARLERSRESGEAGPERSPEQRAAERSERRAAAARGRSAYRKRSRERRKGSGEGTAPAEPDSVAPKIRQGTVVSNKADKTITVRIDIVRRHPAYEKIVRRSSKLHAHDERNEASEGDVVRLVETRPLSRTKRWRLDEILERAK
jgi:small subunit ribosomal protein S17